jgi:hypothetical protein
VENPTSQQVRQSSCRRRIRAFSKDRGKRQAAEENTKQKPGNETKGHESCLFLSVDVRGRFKLDFPGAKDLPTDDELNERYRNVQDTLTTPAAPTETETSEPKEDSQDEEALENTTTLPENTLDPLKTEPTKAEVSKAMPKLGARRNGPGLKKLVKSVSMKLNSKNSAIDHSTEGAVKPASFKMISNTRRKSHMLSGNTMDPFKMDPKEAEGADAMPKLGVHRRGPGLRTFVKSVAIKLSLIKSTTLTEGAKPRCELSKSLSNVKSERGVDWDTINEKEEPLVSQSKVKEKEIAMAIVQDGRVDPSADLKGKKNKHDSSRTRTGRPRPRSGREKEGETASQKDTNKQQDMLGDSIIWTEVDSISAKASKKSNGAVLGRSSTSSAKDATINSNYDVSRSQPATHRKIKFLSRNSMANGMDDNDIDSCENTATTSTLASSIEFDHARQPVKQSVPVVKVSWRICFVLKKKIVR